MGIPEDLLSQVKAYCAAQNADDADMLNLNDAWDSAQSYLAGAGVTEPERSSGTWPLWFQVMKALTLDGFDQRGAQFDQGKLQDNSAFRRQLNQLKLSALPEAEE